jgi:glycosyltransferase involved in cell wall biosynthesis
MTSTPTFSVVVPCFNEAAGLVEFHRRLSTVMTLLAGSWEVVYVNDGSRDETLNVLESLHETDRSVAVVNLSRNFGKEIALTAGLDYARGEAVIIIDADLQDPPELIPELVAVWRQGFDMVYAQRRARDGETWLKKATSAGFYRFMQRIDGKVKLPPNVGDFRLMSRRAVNALLRLREQHRFMKGLFAWIGFPSEAVLYDRAPRHAGSSSWNYWKLWNFAIEGITSFTAAPLKVATYCGLLVALGAVVFGAQLILRTLVFGNSVPGYSSLMVVILFLGGFQLVTIGVIGEYLGRIFNESKNRPLYLIERCLPCSDNSILQSSSDDGRHPVQT